MCECVPQMCHLGILCACLRMCVHVCVHAACRAYGFCVGFDDYSLATKEEAEVIQYIRKWGPRFIRINEQATPSEDDCLCLCLQIRMCRYCNRQQSSFLRLSQKLLLGDVEAAVAATGRAGRCDDRNAARRAVLCCLQACGRSCAIHAWRCSRRHGRHGRRTHTNM